MVASSDGERPFMGRLELDPDDPETQQRILDIQEQASKVGSEVVIVAYRGAPTQVFYGTNHPHQTRDPR